MKAILVFSLVGLAVTACDGSLSGGNTRGEARTQFATGVGLWDQGFKQGVARSELGDINTITIGTCLDPGPCPAGVTCSPCPSGPTTYAQSNFFSTVQPAPSNNFWIVDHNNDTGALGLSFNSCNSGPPDQSLPVSSGLSAPGVFKLAIGAGSNGKRADLALDNTSNPCTDGIPYLGIGANVKRGNGGKLVGQFVRSNSSTGGFTSDVSTIKFKAALTGCSTGAPCLVYFDIYALWNNKPRQVVLTIGHVNHAGSHGHHVHWNWPVAQSYFSPGADIAYLRCENVGVPCLSVGATTSYQLSMSKLLTTASDMHLFDDEIPVGGQVDILGASWAIETAGAGSKVGAWVESMEVVGAASGNSCQGSCGGKAASCWCDTACTSYGDCCPDYSSVCGGSTTGAPVLTFSSVYDGNSTSVTLAGTQTLYGKVTNLSATSAQSCLEVVGRPITQQNGDGWCNDLSHWTTMSSSTAAGSWSYQGGVWRLAVSPVSALFPPGAYRGFWRNSGTGQKAAALFTVSSSSSGGTKSPLGWLDSVAGGVASGWACDPDSPPTSIVVHLYVGGPAGSGATVYGVNASLANEGAVTSACGGGSAHRFQLAIPNWTAMAGKPVHAYGIDVTSNPNAQLSGSPRALPASGPSAGNSCSGRCGKQAADGSCWCDTLCAQYGDCCADKIQQCP